MRGFFVILAQTAKLVEPSKRPLHHSATLLHDKAFDVFLVLAALDALQNPAGKGGDPSNQRARVGAVRPYPAQPSKQNAQFQANQFGSMTVRQGGTMNDNRQEKAQCIYSNVALALFDVLACVVAVGFPFCGVFTN